MQAVNLDAEFRGKKTKGELNSLRKAGFVIGVVYGKEMESVPVLVKEKDVEKILKTRSGINTIIKLKVAGTESSQQDNVMIKDIQYDPLKRNIVHLDIFKFSAESKIQITIPINLVGEAVGQKEGGVLQHLLREVDVECLPTEIPESLDIDISNLQLGHSILVADIAENDKFTIVNDPNNLIVSISAPQRSDEETETDVSPETAVGDQEKAEEE